MRMPKIAPEECYEMIMRLQSDATELIGLVGKICDDTKCAEMIIGDFDYDGMEQDKVRMYEIGLKEMPELIERTIKRLECIAEANKPFKPYNRPILS